MTPSPISPTEPAKSENDDTVRRAQNGERDAVRKLFGDHLPAVQRYALRMCRDRERARDVAQDSLLTALRSLGTYRGEAAFSTWLFLITRSHCGRWKQRAKREMTVDEDTDRAVSISPSPDALLEHSEVSNVLEHALETLDPSDREVVWLRDVDGVSTNDAAVRLGLSVAAFKSRLHRARSTLRKLMRAHVRQRPGAIEPK